MLAPSELLDLEIGFEVGDEPSPRAFASATRLAFASSIGRSAYRSINRTLRSTAENERSATTRRSVGTRRQRAC